jgi:hypothetical protein
MSSNGHSVRNDEDRMLKDFGSRQMVTYQGFNVMYAMEQQYDRSDDGIMNRITNHKKLPSSDNTLDLNYWGKGNVTRVYGGNMLITKDNDNDNDDDNDGNSGGAFAKRKKTKADPTGLQRARMPPVTELTAKSGIGVIFNHKTYLDVTLRLKYPNPNREEDQFNRDITLRINPFNMGFPQEDQNGKADWNQITQEDIDILMVTEDNFDGTFKKFKHVQHRFDEHKAGWMQAEACGAY